MLMVVINWFYQHSYRLSLNQSMECRNQLYFVSVWDDRGCLKFEAVVQWKHGDWMRKARGFVTPTNWCWAPLASPLSRGNIFSTSSGIAAMIHFLLLFSRQGKLRLQKWFDTYQEKTKKKITRDLVATILKRKSKMCSFIEWQDMKIVYKRYASLYFCAAIDVRKKLFN